MPTSYKGILGNYDISVLILGLKSQKIELNYFNKLNELENTVEKKDFIGILINKEQKKGFL